MGLGSPQHVQLEPGDVALCDTSPHSLHPGKGLYHRWLLLSHAPTQLHRGGDLCHILMDTPTRHCSSRVALPSPAGVNRAVSQKASFPWFSAAVRPCVGA